MPSQIEDIVGNNFLANSILNWIVNFRKPKQLVKKNFNIIHSGFTAQGDFKYQFPKQF